ncbi:MAG: DUF2490 domain-containing protein, partial [Myxococcales bacterium]
MSRASLLHLGAAALLLLGLTHDVAEAQMEHDAGLWILANLQGEVAPQWSLNLEVDVRSFDNFARTSELIIQPGVFFNINEHWTWTVQYVYDARPPTNNEHRVLTDGAYHTEIQKFVLGTRLRLTVRFIDNVGTVVRLRHRISALHGIADTPAYLTVSNEIFFNLNDQGSGPPYGFEEDRLFAGVGYHFGPHLRAEMGYMWRPARPRNQPTLSSHIIAVNFFFTT